MIVLFYCYFVILFISYFVNLFTLEVLINTTTQMAVDISKLFTGFLKKHKIQYTIYICILTCMFIKYTKNIQDTISIKFIKKHDDL